MKTWEEIRDEVAGMLADGQPLEDIISKLEQRKNEMAKAELVEVFDELKKPKPMTNEEYIRTCSTEELAEFLITVAFEKRFKERIHWYGYANMHSYKTEVLEWLKEKHNDK